MARHEISVLVEGGSIAVQPDTLVMKSNDEVRWMGKNPHKFAIVFDGSGPFERNHLPHPHATTHQKPRAKGRFKYTVVSEENPSLKLDPVVIVEEPETDPHQP